MLEQNARILNQTEILDIYGVPVLDDVERREYFTFNEQEVAILKSFRILEDSVYFAICLAFFKLKQTLVDFSYRETTSERQHVIERYFNNRNSIRSLPKDRNRISRIENKVLAICNSQRYSGEIVNIQFDIKIINANPDTNTNLELVEGMRHTEERKERAYQKVSAES